MAHGKSLKLRKIQPTIHNSWTSTEWGKVEGNIPGDPTRWPKGMLPVPRRIRRAIPEAPLYYNPRKQMVTAEGVFDRPRGDEVTYANPRF